jgi:DnaJ family protein C protein 8
MGDTRSSATAYDDLLLKSFFAEVSEVERDNEVARSLLSMPLSLPVFTYLYSCMHAFES